MSTQRIDDNQNTQRLDDNQNTQRLDDNQNTQRLDDNQSTQRIDDNQSTQRLEADQSTQRIDSDSTQRIDESASDSGSGASQMQSQVSDQSSFDDGKKTGEAFLAGQVIELNGTNYRIERIVSQSSGEASIYLVSLNNKNYIFKHYKLTYRYPEKVLKMIKDNPQDNVIKLFEYGNRNGQDFEIMEYAEGGTLYDYLEQNSSIKDIVKARSIVQQINEGLNQLHKKLRIVYQDLKPENIYFKDKEKTKIVLADFGISSVMDPGKDFIKVDANVTVGYAAPELARHGNEKEVEVSPAVDYFALGMTIYHMWLGHNPYKGSQGGRSLFSMIRENDFEFPSEMSNEFSSVIRGLVEYKSTARFGYSQVAKWIRGESVVSEHHKSPGIIYDSVLFNDTESYSNLAELAALLEKYPDVGINRLYGESILFWLNKSGNPIVDDIKRIINENMNDKQTGLYKTIYTLDPTRAFISNGGKKCSDTVEIADAIMNESEFYKQELKKRDARLYQYFEAVEGSDGRKVAEQFLLNFDAYNPDRALKLCYLGLQEDGGKSITLGSKTYLSPEDAANETDSMMQNKIKDALLEKDSLFNVWLSDRYGEFFESTEGLLNVNASDKFFILGKFPFLSFKELHSNWQYIAIDSLIDLIHNNPGRHDLFEAYAKQDLPFNGRSQSLDWQPTPINYLVKFFNDIISDINVGANLLNYLNEHGSNVRDASGDGSIPLIEAIRSRNVPLTKMLLDIGADADEPREYPPILNALFWYGESADADDPVVRIQLADLLIEKNANVNVVNQDYTPLMQSLFLKTPKVVDFISRLIKAGADVNKPDENGLTVLMQAVINFCKCEDNKNREFMFNIVELLLKSGAKTEVLNKNGYWSPLMRAVDLESSELVSLMLRYGADKYYADIDGNTAHVYALNKNNYRIANMLKPDSVFKLKAALYRLGQAAITAVSALWIFLAIDVLARGFSLLSLEMPALIVISVLASHFIAAYIGVVSLGPTKYLSGMKRLYSSYSIEKAFIHLISIPLFLPPAIAGLQALTKLLPDNMRMLVNSFSDIAVSAAPGMMIAVFFLPLVIFFAGVLVFYKITRNFARILH